MSIKLIGFLIIVVILILVYLWRKKSATSIPGGTTPGGTTPVEPPAGQSVSGSATMFYSDTLAELYPKTNYGGWDAETNADRPSATIAASDSEEKKIEVCKRIANGAKTWKYKSITMRASTPPKYLVFVNYIGGGNTKYCVKKLTGGIPDLEVFFKSFPYNYFWYDGYEYWDSTWSVRVVSEATYSHLKNAGALEV